MYCILVESFESIIRFKQDLGLPQELHFTGWWSGCLVAKPLSLGRWTHLYNFSVTELFLLCHFVVSEKVEIV